MTNNPVRILLVDDDVRNSMLLKRFIEAEGYEREFGIRKALRMMNRQLEKVADSFGNITDI